MKLGRREFILGGSAALCNISCTNAGIARKPLLRFGVVSDIHIGGRKEAPARLEFALRWLERQDVEAVLCPGDIAHLGRVSQIRQFADIWFRVFPNGRAADGRKVELMISTGNHDAWEMGLAKAVRDGKQAEWLFFGDNAARAWTEILGETWSPVWRKEVKGFTFVGSQWPTYKPDLKGWWARHAAGFDPKRPIFYCQHQAPWGTCAGAESTDRKTDEAHAVFAGCPNVVAISGHSHWTIADARTVWQGGFTSFGAGCLHEGGAPFKYENISAFWHPSLKKNLMAPMNDPDAWGGDPAGGCFEMIDVYDDHLRIARRSSVCDLPIGPDFVVPWPARADGPFALENLKAAGAPPVFASDAALSVAYCAKGDALAGVSYKGQPCVRVDIPVARRQPNGYRVFDYEVRASAANGRETIRKIVAPGFASPPERSKMPAACLFLPTEIPAAEGVTFEVTARDSFGRKGGKLLSAPFSLLTAAGSPKDGRRIVWHDDFDGNALDTTKWGFHQTMTGSDCLYANDDRTVRVADGLLTLTALPSPDPQKRCLLPQGLSTRDKMDFKYGYLEMRAKVPFGHGAWPSFWMTATKTRKTCPWTSEVDIFEVFSSSNRVVSNLHKWGWNSETKKTEHVMLPEGEGACADMRSYAFGHPEKLNDEFHVYGFEWTPDEMSFYVDDFRYATYSIREQDDFAPKNKVVPGMAGYHDFHNVILNNEVFTPGHGWCPSELELKSADLPILYRIDWIRLWQKDNETLMGNA